MNIVRFLTAGGVVMIPLLLFSVTAVVLIIERTRFWLNVTRRQKRVARDVLALYAQKEVETALEKLRRNLDLPLARIFLAALELKRPTPERFRLALETEAQAEVPILKRFNNLFEMIIALSPLLGLLGTVLGLIASFASLRLGDVGGTQTLGVTAGISEALVATASGLVVAIFTLVFASAFRGIYTRQIALMEEYCGRLELLYSDRYEQERMNYEISP